MPVVAIERLTFEDFFSLPEEDERYELVDGQRVPLASPRMAHGLVQGTLFQRINEYLGPDFTEIHNGYFGTELDFPTLPFHGRRGDLVYYAAGHVTEEDWDRGYPLRSPDLVIEVASPGAEARDYVEKRLEYAQIGVLHYWIFDGLRKTLDLLTLQGAEFVLDRRLGPGDTLTPALFPGLRIPLADLFRRV
ncbi:MAG: Uma2 family endonuclease [Armatimonadota bacterium]|nr:Uma2 family endonuclease [Armatimonadota bacterium]